MPLILKIVEDPASAGDASRSEHSVYADVISCTFARQADGWANARIYVRDNVKTAIVPGFSEHEVNVTFRGSAYLMNENGRTVSTFEAIYPASVTGR